MLPRPHVTSGQLAKQKQTHTYQCCQVYDNYRICTIILPSVRSIIPKKAKYTIIWPFRECVVVIGCNQPVTTVCLSFFVNPEGICSHVTSFQPIVLFYHSAKRELRVTCMCLPQNSHDWLNSPLRPPHEWGKEKKREEEEKAELVWKKRGKENERTWGRGRRRRRD